MLEIDLWWLDWHPQFWSRTRRMDLLVLNVHSCGLAEDHRGKGDPTENGLRANLKQQWLPVFFWLAESPCSHATCNCHTQFHRAFGMTPGCPKKQLWTTEERLQRKVPNSGSWHVDIARHGHAGDSFLVPSQEWTESWILAGHLCLILGCFGTRAVNL